MSDSIAIRVRGLSVGYGGKLILENLNFEIKNGEFIGILGKSGTGKTTLLNSLAGFLNPEGDMNIKGNIGFCFQSNSLFHWMTVAENIGFGLNDVKEREQRVSELLTKIGLTEMKNKYPSQLSGGQMQRVALARAVANRPSVLFLDEPFSSLDVFTRDQMIDWVQGFILELNITVVMVTHYLDEALIFADRIFVLNDRKISNDVAITFPKPRTQAIKFTEDFQNNKKQLLNYLN